MGVGYAHLPFVRPPNGSSPMSSLRTRPPNEVQSQPVLKCAVCGHLVYNGRDQGRGSEIGSSKLTQYRKAATPSR